jgi:hypothetical protein
MARISHTDRITLLLQQKLQEFAKVKAKQAQHTGKVEPKRQTGVEAVRALTQQFSRDGAETSQLQRLLVEQLLANQFGDVLANDPRFQQIIDQVTDAMRDDLELVALFNQVMEGLG